jgi:hypothetical protein
MFNFCKSYFSLMFRQMLTVHPVNYPDSLKTYMSIAGKESARYDASVLPPAPSQFSLVGRLSIDMKKLKQDVAIREKEMDDKMTKRDQDMAKMAEKLRQFESETRAELQTQKAAIEELELQSQFQNEIQYHHQHYQ